MLPATSRARGKAALDLGALGHGAAVVPQDRRAQHPVVMVEADRPVHLPREPDAAQPGEPMLARQRRDRRLDAPPPILGVLLRPAGMRAADAQALARLPDELLVTVEEDGLDRGRADVDPEIHGRRPPLRTPAPVAPLRRRTIPAPGLGAPAFPTPRGLVNRATPPAVVALRGGMQRCCQSVAHHGRGIERHQRRVEPAQHLEVAEDRPHHRVDPRVRLVGTGHEGRADAEGRDRAVGAAVEPGRDRRRDEGGRRLDQRVDGRACHLHQHRVAGGGRLLHHERGMPDHIGEGIDPAAAERVGQPVGREVRDGREALRRPPSAAISWSATARVPEPGVPHATRLPARSSRPAIPASARATTVSGSG